MPIELKKLLESCGFTTVKSRSIGDVNEPKMIKGNLRCIYFYQDGSMRLLDGINVLYDGKWIEDLENFLLIEKLN